MLHSYLWTLLEVCDDISSILLYSNYSPCQEAGRECARSLVHFLQAHPWVRLDLLFSRLYRTQPGQPQYQVIRPVVPKPGVGTPKWGPQIILWGPQTDSENVRLSHVLTNNPTSIISAYRLSTFIRYKYLYTKLFKLSNTDQERCKHCENS